MKKNLLLLFFLILNLLLKAQWVDVTNGASKGVTSLLLKDNKIFYGSNNSSVSCGIFMSTDNGSSWIEQNNGLRSYARVSCMTSLDNYIFAGLMSYAGYGIYRSSDGGATWTESNNGIPSGISISCFAVLGKNIFAGTYATSKGVFLSTNYGANWVAVNNDFAKYEQVYALAVLGNNLFAGLTNYGVKVSSDNGATWKSANNGILTNISSITVFSFAVTNDNKIYAGTGQGVYLSTDNGATWQYTKLRNKVINSLIAIGNSVFAGANLDGIYVTTDNGNTWTNVSSGLPSNPQPQAFLVKDNYIYAGLYTQGIWRRPLSQMITDVERTNELPNEFELYQNYPNPFNPSTTIKYSIPNIMVSLPVDRHGSSKGDNLVTLKVYDLLGKEVATLINEYQSAGNYEVKFDGSKLSSGVYFYKLQAGSFVQTRKMILTK